MRFIYEIQSVILTVNKQDLAFEADIEICAHLVTFLILWSIKHFQKAATYVQLASDMISQMIDKIIASNLSDDVQINLCGIISLCLSGVKLKLEKNPDATLMISRGIIEYIHDLRIINLVKSFNEKVENLQAQEESCESTETFEFFPETKDHRKISDMPSLDEFNFEKMKDLGEMLINEEFEDVIFSLIFEQFLIDSP